MKRPARLAVVFGSSLAWFSAPAAPAARADVVHLDDGTSVEGSVKRNGSGWDVTDAAGKVIRVESAHVRQIELSPRAGVDAAMGHLSSLQRSVENLTDPRLVIDRYQKFIDANKPNPAGANAVKEAEKDLALWKDRIDRAMVKVGTRWVTLDERQAMAEKAFAATDEARRLIKENRMKEAEPVLQQALADDPANVSALYLRGLIQYRLEQIPAARQSFEEVKKVLPDNPPTLNNLAVILWRQNAPIPALNAYDAAMIAAPLTREILNNVAEALNALTPEQKAGPVAVKVARHFTEQDTKLQDQLAPGGYYRWGSTWVDREQRAKLEAAEREIDKRISQLSQEFDATTNLINKADEDVEENRRIMKRMDAQSYARDASGNLVRLQLPPSYFELEADNRHLSEKRAELVNKLDQLRLAAKQAKQSSPTPKYTNVQQVIGVEGTPLVPPAKPPAAIH